VPQTTTARIANPISHINNVVPDTRLVRRCSIKMPLLFNKMV
jgi:hypothetical protein